MSVSTSRFAVPAVKTMSPIWAASWRSLTASNCASTPTLSHVCGGRVKVSWNPLLCLVPVVRNTLEWRNR